MSLQNPSSPIRSVSNFRAEHDRAEVANFAIENIKRIKLNDYLTYLNNGNQSTLDYTSIALPSTIEEDFFIKRANMISFQIWTAEKGSTGPRLDFRKTENQNQYHYITKTACRPDVIAAFVDGDKPIGWQHINQVWGWPFIQLVAEVASRGSTINTQRRQAASYVYYMILARPDLYVAHGLLIDKSGVTFFVGITGVGICDVQLNYTDAKLYSTLFALIKHIYDPGHFKDNRCEVTFNTNAQKFEYTLSFELTPGNAPTKCGGFQAMYASNPFETTTYVFATTGGDTKPTMVGNQRLRIVKDQYCRKTRFNEPEILKHIQNTPGVVTLVHDEEWETPVHSEHRIKRRLGLSQNGDPFMDIRTVRTMLEVAYDVLEVTRYLRFKRHILHRDLSIGNIVIDKTATAPTPEANEDSQDEDGRELDICFIKHLLGESNNPRETSVVLIDFNRAERLDTNTTRSQIERTGTPLFIARAVQNNGPYPDLSRAKVATIFPAMPEASPIYKQYRPERTKLFDSNNIGLYFLMRQHAILAEREWRHELYHDAESIFWIIFYWFMVSNPEHGDKPATEQISPDSWFSFKDTDGCGKRDLLLSNLSSVADIENTRTIHSKFSPAFLLLQTLAHAVYPGPYYLPDNDSRTRPDFIPELFQREILNFIIANKDQEFMNLEVNLSRPRGIMIDNLLSKTTSRSHRLTPGTPSQSSSKRASPIPDVDERTTSAQGQSKKPRHEGPSNPYPDLPPSQDLVPESA